MNKISVPITRSITISQEEFTYKLKRSARAKYLRLQISRGSELELVLPRGIEIKEAEDFIIKKAGWIKKHLKAAKITEPQFLLFGEKIEVVQHFDMFAKRHSVHYKENLLKIVSPAGTNYPDQKFYEHWLRRRAKIYLINRALELADNYGFDVNKVTIKGQKTRWGSCSTKGNLNFNFRLMRYRKEVIDYVIIHELCHLRHMNHSKRFWALVGKHIPEYKDLRDELKRKSAV